MFSVQNIDVFENYGFQSRRGLGEDMTTFSDEDQIILDPKKFNLDIHKIIYQNYQAKDEMLKESEKNIGSSNGSEYLAISIKESIVVFILEGLATGILSWLGSQIISNLFGSEPIDLEELLRIAIQELAMIFREIITENELRDALARVEGLEINVREYNRSPTTSRFQLDAAVIDSAYIVTNLKRLGYIGATGFAITNSIRFALQQELYLLDNDLGRLETIKDMKLRAYNEEVGSFYVDASLKNDSFFSEIFFEPFSTDWVCRYKGPNGEYENGQLIWLGRGSPSGLIEAEERYDRIRAENFKKVFEPELQPLYDAALKWFGIETRPDQIGKR